MYWNIYCTCTVMCCTCFFTCISLLEHIEFQNYLSAMRQQNCNLVCSWRRLNDLHFLIMINNKTHKSKKRLKLSTLWRNKSYPSKQNNLFTLLNWNEIFKLSAFMSKHICFALRISLHTTSHDLYFVLAITAYCRQQENNP